MPRKKVEKAKQKVLIESDWNLKWLCTVLYHTGCQVLIESDWNLKDDYPGKYVARLFVLIESDWNLKGDKEAVLTNPTLSINRIRLEFKGQ